jgi:hypothetical protein
LSRAPSSNYQWILTEISVLERPRRLFGLLRRVAGTAVVTRGMS